MIIDFRDIEDEKDRELYVRVRTLIDNWFESNIELHKTKNHKVHECFNREMIEESKGLQMVLDSLPKSIQKAQLKIMMENIADQLVIIIQHAILATEKYEEFSTKH